MDEKILQLQKDLLLAQTAVTEQKEEYLRKDSEREDIVKNSRVELEAKCQQVTVLEKGLEELKEKFHLADTKSSEKDVEIQKLAVVHAELDDLKKKLQSYCGTGEKRLRSSRTN